MQEVQLRASRSVPRLRVGDIVEVRSEEEILATLDERGELDSLPFMPEMLQFCGRRLRVDKLAVKLCDTVSATGMHRMNDAVHLEDVRCDGQEHGGCQAACLIYWKEAWLRPVADGVPSQPLPQPRSGCDRDTLWAATHKAPVDGTEAFSCQVTELLRAAPQAIPWWDLRMYARDVRSGNVRLFGMIRSLAWLGLNKALGLTRRYLPRRMWLLGDKRYPRIDGTQMKTPRGEVLDLQPGELVEVRPLEEIRATLDRAGKNRGMTFDAEMIAYCGRRARVRARVDHILDEKTGMMQYMKNPCIILDDVVCVGDYNQYCPRGIFPYWREIWLKRVDPAEAPLTEMRERVLPCA